MMGVGQDDGRAAAARRGSGRAFVDTDELIERRCGRTVREIFETDGEAAFRSWRPRRWPRRSASARSRDRRRGGVVLDPGNRELLRRAGAVVWLRAPTRGARRHGCTPGDHRPLLGDDAARVRCGVSTPNGRPLYDEVADRGRSTVGDAVARRGRDRGSPELVT